MFYTSFNIWNKIKFKVKKKVLLPAQRCKLQSHAAKGAVLCAFNLNTQLPFCLPNFIRSVTKWHFILCYCTAARYNELAVWWHGGLCIELWYYANMLWNTMKHCVLVWTWHTVNFVFCVSLLLPVFFHEKKHRWLHIVWMVPYSTLNHVLHTELYSLIKEGLNINCCLIYYYHPFCITSCVT